MQRKGHRSEVYSLMNSHKVNTLCNQCPDLDQKPQDPSVLSFNHCLSSRSAACWLPTSPMDFAEFCTSYVWNYKCVLLCAWFVSLNMMCVIFIHVVPHRCISFYFPDCVEFQWLLSTAMDIGVYSLIWLEKMLQGMFLYVHVFWQTCWVHCGYWRIKWREGKSWCGQIYVQVLRWWWLEQRY